MREGSKPGFKAMQRYVEVNWKQRPSVHQLKDGIFLFIFPTEQGKQEILDMRWTFNRAPFVLQPWHPELDINKLKSDKVAIWVKFPGLQLQYRSPWIFGKLASYIGVPLIADQPTTGLERLGFARVMVEVKINKELPKLVPIKSPSGNTMVPVFYEWTPTQCENCKGWGHHADQCKGRKNEQGEC